MKKSKPIEEFIDFINILIERPGMFEVNNINDVGLVILGYKNCRCLASNDADSINKLFDEFYIFLSRAFNVNTDGTWVRLIRYIAGENKASIDLFKFQFNQFLLEYFD